MSKVNKPLFAAAVMILVLASAGCTEMPMGSDPGWSGSLSPEETGGEDNDPGYLTPATPYPTATSTMVGPTLSKPTEVQPTQDPYVTLFNKTIEFSSVHQRDAYSFNLTAPPLIIEFDVEPKMVTRKKYTTSDYGTKKDIVVTQEYPSEDSWIIVTVREQESGKIVAEDGFGKGFGTTTNKRIYLGKFGNYLIELAGNEAKVHVTMRAGGV